jgi:O-acetyl-ADP-ribose deacetylase (regulator of RNase III)
MDNGTLASRTVGECIVTAVLGDITGQDVDAVVNAANTHLAHGGGLAGAIVRRGGQIIQEESNRIAPVAVGSAAVTQAGQLPCSWVIHAVGPRWGEGDEEHKLRSALRSSFEQAHRLGAKSLAVPAISTGIFGYPKADGTRVIVDETMSWLADNPETPMRDVRLTAFDRETADLFASALRQTTR